MKKILRQKMRELFSRSNTKEININVTVYSYRIESSSNKLPVTVGKILLREDNINTINTVHYSPRFDFS